MNLGVGLTLSMTLKTGVVLRWEIVGIFLGATDQESVVALEPIDRRKATMDYEVVEYTTVPVQMVDMMLEAGVMKISQKL